MEPKNIELDAPGAGLPWVELQIARLKFGWARSRRSHDDFAKLFAAERERLLRLAAELDTGLGTRRVLVDRAYGMEDSSRNWSAYMTFEHLRIVNVAFAGIIEELLRGDLPAGEVRTADVKPDPGAGAESIEGFSAACELFSQRSQGLGGQDPMLRLVHPWFGGLNAGGWHALGAVHMKIHRLQIERILKGLASA